MKLKPPNSTDRSEYCHTLGRCGARPWGRGGKTRAQTEAAAGPSTPLVPSHASSRSSTHGDSSRFIVITVLISNFIHINFMDWLKY